MARKHDGLGPRSPQQPYGISGFPPWDVKKVQTGSALMLFSIRLMKLCIERQVAFALENPESSRLWSMPPMVQLYYDTNTSNMLISIIANMVNLG